MGDGGGAEWCIILVDVFGMSIKQATVRILAELREYDPPRGIRSGGVG